MLNICAVRKVFQSTLPARGATVRCRLDSYRSITFQSTLPARGATYLLHPMERFGNYFNPRSPHGERRGTVRYHLLCRYFNPRSPHGERHRAGCFPSWRIEFQSTLPARGATQLLNICAVRKVFQSTLPARGATVRCRLDSYRSITFQSTLPARGATYLLHPMERFGNYFNPRSPHGERLCHSVKSRRLF